MKFRNVFVYTTMHPLEDSYDFEGMMEGKDAHEEIKPEDCCHFSQNCIPAIN